MFARRNDIPFDGDPANRFLPWLVALMTFLSGLAVSLALILSDAAARWEAGVVGSLTVQVPLNFGPDSQRKLGLVLDVLKSTPGVIDARPISKDESLKLVQPWLGDAGLWNDLNLPMLVEVAVEPAVAIDQGALQLRLEAVVPGTLVDDHKQWLDRLVAAATGLQLLAFLVLALIGGGAILSVVFAMRASLAVHHDIIELLHLMGARDAYIGRQFRTHALKISLKGGTAGTIGAIVTLAILAPLFDQIGSGLLPPISLGWGGWLLIACLPLAAALLATITAWIAVDRALAEMM